MVKLTLEPRNKPQRTTSAKPGSHLQCSTRRAVFRLAEVRLPIVRRQVSRLNVTPCSRGHSANCGITTEQVNVTADASMVNTQSGALSQVVSSDISLICR
jgi:hypothetical protein